MLTATSLPPSVNNSLLNYPAISVNYAGLSGLASRLESRKRVSYSKTTHTPKLPLKKRALNAHFIDNSGPNDCPLDLVAKKEPLEEEDAEDTAAMDFSLPTRTRAKGSRTEDDLNSCGGSKSSPHSSCSDSSDNPIYLGIKTEPKSISPSCVSKCTASESRVDSVAPGQSSVYIPHFPLLHGKPQLNSFNHFINPTSSSGLAMSGCFPAPAIDQLSLLRALTAMAAGLNNIENDNDDDNSEDYGDHPEHFVINPATGNKVRRNYKNMTRERRMEANARERTRVHTIGETFDRLRKLIPCFGSDQKLSKLSILKISCKYIQLMGALMGRDYSSEQKGISVQECVQQLNEAINAEAKGRR